MKFLLFLNLAAIVYSSPEENKNVVVSLSREGDILLTPEQFMARGSFRRNLWADGVLVYEFSSSFAANSHAVAAANAAMKEWSKTTCIRFKRRTTEKDYVSFVLKDGCSSYIGRVGGKQELRLGKGCRYKGTAIHEIGHALGFFHEQSRPDRDKFVTIKYENIKAGEQYNFDKQSSSTIDSLGTEYDYSSIMHYGPRYFSKNGRATIVPKKQGVRIGQRSGLSTIDIKQTRLLYKCQGTIINYGYNCAWRPSKAAHRCWRYCDPKTPSSGSWCWTTQGCGSGFLGLSKGTCDRSTLLLSCDGSCGSRK